MRFYNDLLVKAVLLTLVLCNLTTLRALGGDEVSSLRLSLDLIVLTYSSWEKLSCQKRLLMHRVLAVATNNFAHYFRSSYILH